MSSSKTNPDTCKTDCHVMQWFFIVLYFAVTLLAGFWLTPTATEFLPVMVVFSIFIAAWIHGQKRYGLKNMLVFFFITWLVSHFFEAYSIQTGFPFGYYFYDKLAGPRLFEVPLVIMFAYFGTGYASWMIAHILTGQYHKPLSGRAMFLVPLVATFIMVMWDLCMDPICSTIGSLWVWKDGGAYFGVPIKNYFGWFFVVYIIFQAFALYISRHDNQDPAKDTLFNRKLFWVEIVTIYAIQAFTQWVEAFGAKEQHDIYNSMALVTLFTMMFVVLLAFITIRRSSRLH